LKKKTKKTTNLKTNRIPETNKTLNGNCLKEFSMRMLKVSVVMNKFKSFRDSFLGKILFLCWSTKKKPKSP
jgi:hypothetical protein